MVVWRCVVVWSHRRRDPLLQCPPYSDYFVETCVGQTSGIAVDYVGMVVHIERIVRMMSFGLVVRSGRIVGMVSFGLVVGMVVRSGRSLVVGMVVGKMDVRGVLVDSVDANLIVDEGGNGCNPEKTLQRCVLWKRYGM